MGLQWLRRHGGHGTLVAKPEELWRGPLAYNYRIEQEPELPDFQIVGVDALLGSHWCFNFWLFPTASLNVEYKQSSSIHGNRNICSSITVLANIVPLYCTIDSHFADLQQLLARARDSSPHRTPHTASAVAGCSEVGSVLL